MILTSSLFKWFVVSSYVAETVVQALVFPSKQRIGGNHYSVVSQIPNWWCEKPHPSKMLASPLYMISRDSTPPDFTVIEDDDDDEDNDNVNAPEEAFSGRTESFEESDNKESSTIRSPKSTKKLYATRGADGGIPKKSRNKRMAGTSWLEKNAAFSDEVVDDYDDYGSGRQYGNGPPKRSNRTFRQDFQGTRVFVQGIPKQASWQDLKDHFAMAGTVVFASVSVDAITGESKGVGIVQFETSEMAENAIRIMRNHPLDGSTLFVREDVQEKRGNGATLRNPKPRGRPNAPPSQWECADDENSSILSAEERESVIDLIKARDAARRRRNYEASDKMRQDLKSLFGVHVDDRLKQWWVSFDGSHVPQKIVAVKGEGRWGGKKAWRQIPTTPEHDACVDPDLVNGLLMQRDIARREKDFSTADALLEEARNSPDGDLYLRIHDESRTWRIWTDEPPPRPIDHSDSRKSAAEQCIDLVREKAPHKLDEIETLLQKFPGREYNILKKLRKSLKDL